MIPCTGIKKGEPYPHPDSRVYHRTDIKIRGLAFYRLPGLFLPHYVVWQGRTFWSKAYDRKAAMRNQERFSNSCYSTVSFP